MILETIGLGAAIAAGVGALSRRLTTGRQDYLTAEQMRAQAEIRAIRRQAARAMFDAERNARYGDWIEGSAVEVTRR